MLSSKFQLRIVYGLTDSRFIGELRYICERFPTFGFVDYLKKGYELLGLDRV